MKILNKAIFEHIISMIIFIIVLVVITIVITLHFLHTNIQNVYVDNGMMIQINPKINKDLEALSDIEGLKIKSNVISITNNNYDTKKYQVYLTPLNDDDESIRVLLDGGLLRSLSKFEKVDDSYLITGYSLPPNLTRVHTISMWKDKKEENKKINVNFKINVKILD